MIPSWAAWPLASFAATAIYLTATSLQLPIAENREDGDPEGVRDSRLGRVAYIQGSHQSAPPEVSFVTAMTLSISRRPDCLRLAFKPSRLRDAGPPVICWTETLSVQAEVDHPGRPARRAKIGQHSLPEPRAARCSDDALALLGSEPAHPSARSFTGCIADPRARNTSGDVVRGRKNGRTPGGTVVRGGT